ncbi:MAG: redoxin domain-containing protein [Gemmatimonadota bacterium]|nr:redoxin domain-containing protein [Gemmatimonadota bacterium]
MRQPLAVVCAVIVSFGLGMFLAGSRGAPDADREDTSPPVHIPVALQRQWFPPITEYDTEGEPLDDEQFDALLSHLDAALTAEETLADFETEAEAQIWAFIRRLAVPEVTDEQKERATAYLEELAEEHPDHRSMIEQRAGMLASYAASMPDAPPANMTVVFFGDAAEYDTEGEPFEDAQVDRLLGTLDAALSLPEVAADMENEAGIVFWRFGNRLQKGLVTDEQSARIAAYFEDLGDQHPDAGEFLDRQRFLVERLTPGKVAPNIVGMDTEGVEFALEDYRGRIVTLIFSGQWCGPCRGEYPYQRGMLEIYDEEDVVLLGVNSDAKLETIVEAKKDERLHYRTWWDGHSQPDADVAATEGPIATEWNVTGWPAIYVLDEEGVIRHVNERGGALIAAVDALVMEKRMRGFQAQREAAEAEAETGEAGDEAGGDGDEEGAKAGVGDGTS